MTDAVVKMSPLCLWKAGKDRVRENRTGHRVPLSNTHTGTCHFIQCIVYNSYTHKHTARKISSRCQEILAVVVVVVPVVAPKPWLPHFP